MKKPTRTPEEQTLRKQISERYLGVFTVVFAIALTTLPFELPDLPMIPHTDLLIKTIVRVMFGFALVFQLLLLAQLYKQRNERHASGNED